MITIMWYTFLISLGTVLMVFTGGAAALILIFIAMSKSTDWLFK